MLCRRLALKRPREETGDDMQLDCQNVFPFWKASLVNVTRNQCFHNIHEEIQMRVICIPALLYKINALKMAL